MGGGGMGGSTGDGTASSPGGGHIELSDVASNGVVRWDVVRYGQPRTLDDTIYALGPETGNQSAHGSFLGGVQRTRCPEAGLEKWCCWGVDLAQRVKPDDKFDS
ncbi:hypothetical protein MTO96_001081 [Rhipicephalus appendiculatus]